MPCLNEAETLGTCIRKAVRWLETSGTDGEVVVADNGSTDGSQEIARKSGARVVHVPVRGYGSALYYGSMAADGDFIIMGDSDDSYDFSRLDAFLGKLDEGYDLVMGNRFLGGIAPSAMPWKNRYFGNPILTWVGRTLFKSPASDFHCGLRGYSKDAFKRMDLRTSGMEFASEMVIKATLMGMRIAEVPTTLSKDGRSRPPHLNPWRDGWRHLRFMLLFSPRWLFLYPGGVALFLSALIYFAILAGPVDVAGVGLGVHTLLYAQAGMTLGLLSIVFGTCARMFGMREGFLQEHRLLEFVRTSPTLEIGAVAGLLCIAVGVALGTKLVEQWGERGFGPLEYGVFMRSVSLSTLFVTTGGIFFLFSLLVGFLALPTRR